MAFDEQGLPLPPPTALVDNVESWLGFTDLVFVDPVGTGFSRIVPDKAAEGGEASFADPLGEGVDSQVAVGAGIQGRSR